MNRHTIRAMVWDAGSIYGVMAMGIIMVGARLRVRGRRWEALGGTWSSLRSITMASSCFKAGSTCNVHVASSLRNTVRVSIPSV